MNREEDDELLQVMVLGFFKRGVLCKCGHTTTNHFDFDDKGDFIDVECTGQRGYVSDVACGCTQFIQATNIDYLMLSEAIREREK